MSQPNVSDLDLLRRQVLEILDIYSSPLPRTFDRGVLTNLEGLTVSLKALGSRFEARHKELVERLQVCFTSLCQDKCIEVRLRLQLLEVIELRSLGWVSNPLVDSYYRERFGMLANSDTKGNQKEDTGNINNNSRSSPSSLPVLSYAVTGGDAASNMKQVSTLEVEGGTEIKIFCANSAVRLKALRLLKEGFKAAPCNSFRQYSKDVILRLASSPLSREPPVEWDQVLGDLPKDLLRKK